MEKEESGVQKVCVLGFILLRISTPLGTAKRAERRAACTGDRLLPKLTQRFSLDIYPVTLLRLLGLRHRRYSALSARQCVLTGREGRRGRSGGAYEEVATPAGSAATGRRADRPRPTTTDCASADPAAPQVRLPAASGGGRSIRAEGTAVAETPETAAAAAAAAAAAVAAAAKEVAATEEAARAAEAPAPAVAVWAAGTAAAAEAAADTTAAP